MTEPRNTSTRAGKSAAPEKAAASAPKAVASAAAAPRPARAARPATLIVPSAPEPNHPNIGKAPANMNAAYPQSAAALRAGRLVLSASAMRYALAADDTFGTRHGEKVQERLLRDTETLIERLAMCVSSGDSRWLAEYAEWIGPIYRRRGVPLSDVAALCEGLRSAAGSAVEEAAVPTLNRSLDAGIAVLNKNGRIGGDKHKRNALLRWLYRGV